MSALTWATAGVVLVGAIACAPKRSAVQIDPERTVEARRWTAVLATPSQMQGAIQARGVAYIAPGENSNESVVQVQLSNLAPGGRHPWVVTSGQCGGGMPGGGMGGGDVVRVTDEGRMLKVNDDGRASADVTLSGTPFPTSGTYAIEILASPTNQELVIACGNFAPPPVNTSVTP
jgi:hypothetical protein